MVDITKAKYLDINSRIPKSKPELIYIDM